MKSAVDFTNHSIMKGNFDFGIDFGEDDPLGSIKSASFFLKRRAF